MSISKTIEDMQQVPPAHPTPWASRYVILDLTNEPGGDEPGKWCIGLAGVHMAEHGRLRQGNAADILLAWYETRGEAELVLADPLVMECDPTLAPAERARLRALAGLPAVR